MNPSQATSTEPCRGRSPFSLAPMRAGVITTVCVLTLFAAAFVTHRYVDRNYAQPSRDLSKMMSVRLIIAEALTAHYQERGSYPRSLTELPLQTLRWGDEGSSVRDVEAWHYASDGSSFTMTWTNVRGPELFLGGRTGAVYYSRDEKR